MFIYPLFVAVALASPGGQRLAVETPVLRFELDLKGPGAAVSLRDQSSGRERSLADPSALFRLEFSESNKAATPTQSCHAGDARVVRREPFTRGEDRGFKITCTDFARPGLEVVCTVFTRGSERQVRFGLEISLPENLVLESVAYPVLSLGAFSENGADDCAVVGATKGGIHRLIEWKPGETRRFDQPGSLAAGFGCCYGKRIGFYTAAYDAAGYRKSLSLKRTVTGLELSWRHPCFHRGRFVLPYDVALAGFAGCRADQPVDWRDAADLYKAWAIQQPWCARRFVDRDDLPRWLREGPAMVRFTRSWLAQPHSVEAWFSDYWCKQFSASSPLIAAYWGWERVGKWVGPHYFPAYPSDESFRHLVRFGRERGIHSFLWPSGYNYSLSYGKRPDGGFLWDRREDLDAIRPHAAVKRDGQPLVRDCLWLRGGQQCVMCPGDPWTIDWLNRSAIEAARRGVEMIQIDQVVGGNAAVCYCPSHNHPPGPGRWSTDAFRKQLRTMLRQCRAIEPDAVVGFEEPNEWFLPEVGIQDYRDCDLIWSGREPASVFSYLYHEYLPTLFQSNRPQTGHDPWALAWCLVQGQMPHLAPRLGLGRGPMIIDGGFEQWCDDGPVEFGRTLWFPGQRWSSGETQRDVEQPHAGRASLKLYNTVASDRALAAQNYEVTEHFRPGRTYRLSIWMRSRGIARPNGLIVNAFAPGMSLLEEWTLAYPSDQPQWTRRQIDFSLPPGTTVVRIMLALEGLGTVWLDDLKIEEVLQDGKTVEVQRPALPVDHQLIREWVRLYQGEGRPYLLFGKMLHPPRLTTADPVAAGPRHLPPVLHNAFQAPDGSQAVVLANWTSLPQTVRLDWKGRIRPLLLGPQEVRLEK